MFEKLREYSLYIILGVIALGALAYAFVQTTNSQKGAAVLTSVQDTLIGAIQKNDQIREKTTIANHLEGLNGKTIGQYKVAAELGVIMNNENGDDVILDGKSADLKNFTVAETVTAGKLGVVMLTEKKINETGTDTFASLFTDSKMTIDNTKNADKEKLKNVNETLKGFMTTGYVGFGTFDKKSDAKTFRDSYFSTGTVVEGATDKEFVVFVKFSN